MLETRQLRIFLAVADTLHFGRAARKLRMAQPNLSQQVARLEALVGYPLFVRNAKGVRLSPAGEFLKQRAAVMVANLHGALETTRRLGRGDAGSLVAGFCGSVMLTDVAGMIGGFRAAYPEVTLELRELHVNQQVKLLQDGMLDVCFLRDAGGPAELTTVTLIQEPYVAVLPERHPLAARKKLEPELLKDEPFILFSPDMARIAYDRTVALCQAHGFIPNVQREAAQWTSLATLIGAGLGVSIAPACVAKVLVPGVCCIPLVSNRRTSVEIAFREDCGNPSVNELVRYAGAFGASERSGVVAKRVERFGRGAVLRDSSTPPPAVRPREAALRMTAVRGGGG